MEDELIKDKLSRRVTKKKRRKYRIHGKGLGQWYQNVLRKLLKTYKQEGEK